MNLIDRTRNYFRASKEELLAVTWPSRQDIIRYTGLVIITVVVFGIFFSALDFVINAGVQAIIASKNAQTQTVPTTEPTATSTVETNPVQVEAVTPDGTPAEVKIEQVPLDPAPASGTPAQN